MHDRAAQTPHNICRRNRVRLRHSFLGRSCKCWSASSHRSHVSVLHFLWDVLYVCVECVHRHLQVGPSPAEPVRSAHPICGCTTIGCRHDDAPWSQVLAVALACAVVSAACFSNALDAEFVFDDNGAIVDNPDVVAPGELWSKVQDMVQHDYWGNDMGVSSHKSYRPLTILR